MFHIDGLDILSSVLHEQLEIEHAQHHHHEHELHHSCLWQGSDEYPVMVVSLIIAAHGEHSR